MSECEDYTHCLRECDRSHGDKTSGAIHNKIGSNSQQVHKVEPPNRASVRLTSPAAHFLVQLAVQRIAAPLLASTSSTCKCLADQRNNTARCCL